MDARATGRSRGGRLRVALTWAFGFGLVATVALVATHYAEGRDFARLVEQAQPAWLVLGVLLQAGTYLAEAGSFWVILRHAGARRPIGTLVRLAFSKLFLDQAVPSGGLSGTLLVINGLERRGVARATATAAVLLDLRAFYAAFAAALLAALALAWHSGHLTVTVAAFSGVFLAIAAVMIVLLTRWSHGRHLRWAERLPGLRTLLHTLEAAGPAVRSDFWLFARCLAFELAIVLLDAATVAVMLLAVGAPAHFGTVFVSFMLASVARTLGVVPGGLGTFEAVSVAALGSGGVPVAAALAATLLFRGLSFWLPLAPGLVLARLELRKAEAPRTASEGGEGARRAAREPAQGQSA